MRRSVVWAAVGVVALAVLYVPVDSVPLIYDALGYSAQSVSLAQGDGNTVPMGDEHIPGYYPAGVPFLASLAVRLLGPDLRHGIVVILACGVLTVLLTARLARRLGGNGADLALGVAAGLLLLASPVFRHTGGTILSQVPTALAVVVATGLYLRRDSRLALFGAGLLAAGSLLLRFANVSFPAAMGLVELFVIGRSRGAGRWRSTAILGAGMALGVLAVALHNDWANGHPFRTGYMLWKWDVGAEFSLAYFHEDFSEKRLYGEHWPLLKDFLGWGGRLYAWPVAVLLVGGLVSQLRDRQAGFELRAFAWLLAGALATQYAMLSVYFYKADLYQVSPLSLVFVMAVLAARSLVGRERRWWIAAAAGAWLAAVLVTAPPPKGAVTEALERHGVIARAARELPGDAVLLTTADSSLAEATFRLGTEREILYLGPFVSPLTQRVAERHLGAEETPDAVVAWATAQLQRGRPVFFDRSPPPRYEPERHAALRKALSRAFRFENPTPDGPEPAPIVRLLPRD